MLRLKLRVGRGYEKRGELQESNFWQERVCSFFRIIKIDRGKKYLRTCPTHNSPQRRTSIHKTK